MQRMPRISVLFVMLIVEIKHYHRNILIHLQRCHILYMAEYEAKQPEPVKQEQGKKKVESSDS